MTETATDHTRTARPVRTVAGFLLGRWPSAIALGFVALTAADGVSPAGGAIAALIGASAYLVAAALDWRRAAWIAVPVGTVAVFASRLAGLDPLIAGVVVCAGFFVWGAYRGRLRGWYPLLACGIAVVVCAAMIIGGVRVGTELGSYLVAAALIGHGTWDVVHHRTDRVVERSLAEFCFVLDYVLGFALLAVTLF